MQIFEQGERRENRNLCLDLLPKLINSFILNCFAKLAEWADKKFIINRIGSLSLLKCGKALHQRCHLLSIINCWGWSLFVL